LEGNDLSRGPIAVAEGFYLSHVVYHLHRRGVLERLRSPASASALAAECGYDAGRLGPLLEFVVQRTDILVHSSAGAYRLNPQYEAYVRLGFHLDKFIGAYGPLVTDLDSTLRPGARVGAVEDELAKAFGGVGMDAVGAQAEVIRQWEVSSLLDLGCGTGTLLIELARRDGDFRGWGVDRNAAMCELAVSRVREAGLSDVVRILSRDVRELSPGDLVVDGSGGGVDALHGRSLLNEFFGSGPAEAAGVVADLRRRFPGRLFFVSDYYGKLGALERVDAAYAHTLVHDVAQVLSGQGVPPPDLEGWAAVYAAGGAELLHAYEGEGDGIAAFIHVLRL
jgi:SAM-dependent methyltransferase